MRKPVAHNDPMRSSNAKPIATPRKVRELRVISWIAGNERQQKHTLNAGQQPRRPEPDLRRQEDSEGDDREDSAGHRPPRLGGRAIFVCRVGFVLGHSHLSRCLARVMAFI